MKKTIVAFSLLASMSIFAACSSSKKAPEENTSKKSIYGTWTLNSITLDGITNDQFDVKVLNNIPRQCMVNSTWLLPSNGYGNYTITQSGAGCPSGATPILWSRISENGANYLQFKELQSGVKDKNVTSGYRFEMVTQSAANMVLRNPISIAGRNTYIVYSFTRNQ